MNTERQSPLLIVLIEPDDGWENVRMTPTLREGPPPDAEILAEGFELSDPMFDGQAVAWRLERRGEHAIYCSTVEVTREYVLNVAGSLAEQVLLPGQESALITFETDVTTTAQYPKVAPKAIRIAG